MDCVQTSVKDALLNISTNPFLAIPSMPQLISKFSIVDGDQDQTTEAGNPPHDDDDDDDDVEDSSRNSHPSHNIACTSTPHR